MNKRKRNDIDNNERKETLDNVSNYKDNNLNDNNNNSVGCNQKLKKKFKELDFDNTKYKELQNIAGSIGLLRSGKKDELYSRIEKYLNEEKDEQNQEIIIDSLETFRANYLCENLTYIQIQEIAKSFGLVISGSKQDLFKRIEDYLALKQATIKEIQEKDNINSFNKERNQLKSTNNLDPVELLFWDVFRNKTLFKAIFSNFDSINKSYEDLYCIGWFLQYFTNAEAIIRDKVKSNSYFIKNNLDIENIFTLIKKNTLENKEFYKQLYNSYSSHNQLNQFRNSSVWLKVIIKSGNITALEQYISQFNIGSEEIKITVASISSIHFKTIKMFNYLKSNDYLLNQDTKPKLACDLFLYEKSFKVKQLVKTFNNITTFYNNNNNNEKYNSLINQLKQQQQQEKPLFTKDQLNLTIREFLTHQFHQKKQQQQQQQSSNELDLTILIKNYYKTIIYIYNTINNFPNSNKKITYYLLFTKKKSILDIAKSQRFVYHDHFKDYFEFSLCGNREEQINSTIQVAKDIIRDPKLDFYSYPIVRYLLLSSDLELIDAFLKQFESFSLENMLDSINSIKVLDYIYKSPVLKPSLFSSHHTWRSFSNIQILEHYESLLQLEQITIINCSYFDKVDNIIKRYDPGSAAIYKMVLDLFLSFRTDCIVLSKIPTWALSYDSSRLVKWLFSFISKQDIINSFKFIISNYYLEFKLYKCGNKISIINNYGDGSIIDLESKDIRKTTFQLSLDEIFNCLAVCGRVDELFEIINEQSKYYFDKSRKILFSYYKFSTTVKLQILKHSYDNIDKDNFYYFICQDIVENSIICGSLSTIKRILSSYPNLLKKKNAGGIFENSKIQQFVVHSIVYSHQELAEFLLNLIGLSSKEIKNAFRNNHFPKILNIKY